jgi:hypothetical protein
MMRPLLALLLAGAVCAASAADRDAVQVRALRDPVDKSYRRMVEGMDLFEALHARAPGAELRYKLLPRKRDTVMDGIALSIVGDSFEVPVAVAADRTFALERRKDALREDAAVRPDRKARSLTWRAEVRTPGLPPDTRRLGDLRLECRVGLEAGLVSEDPSLLGGVMKLLRQAGDFCDAADDVRYLFFSERPLFGLTLRSGERSEALSVGQLYAGLLHGLLPKDEVPYCDCEVMLDRAYELPLGDRRWPDDTLVELHYMDEAPAAPKALPEDDASDAVRPGASTKADVRAALGAGAVARFDSGYEVWTYSFGPQKARTRKTEFVVLFAPSGIVANTRLRVAPQK